MTNPGQIVRVRGRANSRASVYEANAWAQAYTSGLFDGNGTQQNTSANMSVLVGGSTTKPDVVLAQNPAGYKIALDLVGQQLLTLTTPASNSRISAIVAYTDDISINGSDTSTTGSPSSCGLIIVNGTSAATPSAPTDAQIRSAITADGATGSQASYGIIATIPVASNTTTITNSMIVNNSSALSKSGVVKANNIDFATSVDANGWSVAKLSSKIIIYQKLLGSVNASTVAVSMPNNPFPVGEMWDTCGPYTKIYARTISGTSGIANDIRAIARGAGGSSTFDALVTAGANTTAYITAEIIKVG